MEENYNIEYALERILEKKENEMESIQPEKKRSIINKVQINFFM